MSRFVYLNYELRKILCIWCGTVTVLSLNNGQNANEKRESLRERERENTVVN